MLATILQIPNGTIENVQVECETAVISLYSKSEAGKCPHCHYISTGVHSYYSRYPDDLLV
jgi:hypothetical protein